MILEISDYTRKLIAVTFSWATGDTGAQHPSVAQLGSASGLGPEGREFKSLHLDTPYIGSPAPRL